MSRPARGDVGRDQQVGGAAAQPTHHPVALLLAHAAVQRLGAVAPPVQRLGQLVDLVARTAEHDRRRRVPPRRGPGRAPPACAHGRRRTRSGGPRGASPDGVDARARSRCGPGRAGGVGRCRSIRGGIVAENSTVWRSGGTARKDRLEVLGEAHVEHLVGLVEHDDLDRSSVERAAVEVVQRPARRRHDDVDAALELAQLPPDRLRRRRSAAPARRAPGRTGAAPRTPACQLARGHQDERHRLRAAVAGSASPLQDRQRERRGLPGAGRGLAEQVAARSSGGIASRWIGVGSS